MAVFLQLQPVVWERIAECREEGGSLRCPEGFFLAGILLLMLLCAGQGKTEYFMEVMKDPETGFTGERWLHDLYTLLCAFSGAGLLPSGWSMQKQGSARKPVILAFLTVSGSFLNAAPSSGSLWRCTP